MWLVRLALRRPYSVVVLAVPCILLFLVLQRYYVRGFMSGAFKG